MTFKKIFILLGVCCLIILGCEDTNMRLATEAGMEAVKALTLSEDQVRQLSAKTADYLDNKHRIAPPDNPYAERLRRLVADHEKEEGYKFHYKVYLSSKVNAFALADGNIRVYRGLMDMLNDEELLFVLGHEMGHIIKEHTQEKMRLALAGSALRKGVASQQNIVGDLARSSLGGFVEQLLSAQFSQQEEREADDFGLSFMQQEGYSSIMAVSALKKLSTLGGNHSFLSTHPAPKERAERLQNRLQNPDKVEKTNGIWQRIWNMLKMVVQWMKNLLGNLLGEGPENKNLKMTHRYEIDNA